jgi:hypothetical protein
MIGFLMKYLPGNLYVNSLIRTFAEVSAYALAGLFFQ